MTSRAEFEARREAVASRMTADPEKFDMRVFNGELDCLGIARESLVDCGTTHCIAGFTWMEMGLPWKGWFASADLAAEYLGLPNDSCNTGGLFMDFSLKTPEDAALALKGAPCVTDEEVSSE